MRSIRALKSESYNQSLKYCILSSFILLFSAQARPVIVVSSNYFEDEQKIPQRWHHGNSWSPASEPCQVTTEHFAIPGETGKNPSESRIYTGGSIDPVLSLMGGQTGRKHLLLKIKSTDTFSTLKNTSFISISLSLNFKNTIKHM